MGFVHLHVHSYFSSYQALHSPGELVAAAKAQGAKALALTDTGVCAGYPSMLNACEKAGIKPLFGMEVAMAEDMEKKERGEKRHNVLLLAKNKKGHRNIVQLSTAAHLKGFYVRPRIDFKTLEAHREGLICLSADTTSEIYSLMYQRETAAAEKAACRFREAFGDDYYVEIMRQEHTDQAMTADKRRIMDELLAMARRLGIGAVATNDVRYAKKTDAKYHDIFMCLQQIECVKDPNRFSMRSDDFYMKTEAEMRERFADCPDLVDATEGVAAKIETGVFGKEKDCIPGDHIAEKFKMEPFALLRQLVYDGLKAKGLDGNPQYVKRAEHELLVFNACGYVNYFLILWDFINFARTNSIRIGVGRGSAAGSLCLYATGITGLDPIKYDLMFERFLSVDTYPSVTAADFGMEG